MSATKLTEAKRTLAVENSCWTLARTAVKVARTIRSKSIGTNLRATVTASSSQATDVDLGTAKSFSFSGLMKLQAHRGDEVLVRASGPNAEEVLDLIAQTAAEVSKQTVREYEESMEYARRQGDLKRARRYAAYIGLSSK